MENKENKIIMEYNKIINYICSLDNYNLEELENKLAEDKGIDYNKIETFILNGILQLVFCGRFEIKGNRFINTNKTDKEIDEEGKTILYENLVKITEKYGDDIYLDEKQNVTKGR